jgi:hypothetical protein
MLISAGWVNRHQQDVIEYLQEENRALREQLGGKRLKFTDRQRRRLAVKAKAIAAGRARKRFRREATSRSKTAIRDRDSGDAGYSVSLASRAGREKI